MPVNQPRYPPIGRLPITHGGREINYHLPCRWAVGLREAPDVFYQLCLIAWVKETLIVVGICISPSPTLVVVGQSSAGNTVFLSNLSIRKRFSFFQGVYI